MPTMLEEAGSFSLVWLLLWATLTLVFGSAYFLLRNKLMNLHPAHSSALILTYWASPTLLSLLLSFLLFFPQSGLLLISPHCHGDCGEHAPMLQTGALGLIGLLIVTLVLLVLMTRFTMMLLTGRRIRRQLDQLVERRPGFSEILSADRVVFTLGWWHPRIYISSGLLVKCTDKQLAVIVDHEKAHRRRKDNLRLLLGNIFSLALPPVWRKTMQHDLHLTSEQACDCASAARHGRIQVAETLVYVGRLLKPKMQADLATGINGADLQLRVEALLMHAGGTPLSRWQLSGLMMIIAASVLIMLNPLHHGLEWLVTVIQSQIQHHHL
jgi:Zn-dependent protease with chaperone function